MSYYVRAEVRCEYATGEDACIVHASLEPDNEGYIQSAVEGNTITARAESEGILTMRSTLDDLLACLDTSERVMEQREE